MRKCLIVGLRHQCNQWSQECLGSYCLQHVEYQKKYEDPLRIKFVAKSSVPEVVVANATSFFLTIFVLCDVFCRGDYQVHLENVSGGDTTHITHYGNIDADSDYHSYRQLCCISRGNFFSLLLFSCLPEKLLDLIDNQKLNSLFKIQPDKKPVAGLTKTHLYTMRNNVLFILPILFQVFMHGPWLYLQPRCLYYCSGYDCIHNMHQA